VTSTDPTLKDLSRLGHRLGLHRAYKGVAAIDAQRARRPSAADDIAA
jgi:hypothetical protein